MSSLGVGKNMVSSILYWSRASGFIEENTTRPTDLGQLIFGDHRTTHALSRSGATKSTTSLTVSVTSVPCAASRALGRASTALKPKSPTPFPHAFAPTPCRWAVTSL